MSIFGKNVKKLREKKGQTQEEIARLLKISRATVCKYESGEREPDIETIKFLAKNFNVSVDYILGLTEYEGFYKQDNIKQEASFRTTKSSCEASQLINDKDIIHLALKIAHHQIDINALDRMIDTVIELSKK